MSIKDFCRKEVVTVKPGTMIKDVTRIMEDNDIGCLIVSQECTGHKVLGIVTDRDIALKVVNNRIDPQTTPIDEIITKRNLVFISEDMDLFEALEQVKNTAVRRFPVVDAEGNLQGIIAIDDIIMMMAREMSNVAKVIENESPGGRLQKFLFLMNDRYHGPRGSQ